MTQSKADQIEEVKQNLPLPEQPPVKSDFNSADASTVNVGSGRDVEGALPLDMIRMVLDPKGELPLFESIADKGVGVFESLKAVSKLVLERLSQPK